MGRLPRDPPQKSPAVGGVEEGAAQPLSWAPASVLAAVLDLNRDHEAALAPLDMARLRRLVSTAFMATVIGEGVAFILTHDEAAQHDSPNFEWFRRRYPSFVYVDRIAVASAARGRGLGRALYENLFEAARTSGRATICCEINVDPPNPLSDAFHAAMAFHEVGQAALASGKRVRYMVRTV